MYICIYLYWIPVHSRMQSVRESVGGCTFAVPHFWIVWKHSNVVVKMGWIRFIKVSWCCFWRTKLFFSQRWQNQSLWDLLAVCYSCRNVLYSKGYPFLWSSNCCRRCPDISQESWSSGRTTCLLLKPLRSGCDGQSSASEVLSTSFTFTDSKQEVSSLYLLVGPVWAWEWFSSVLPFHLLRLFSF